MAKSTKQRRWARAKIKLSRKNLHVIPYAKKWALIKEGDSKVGSTFDTQIEAIEEARKLAKETAGELIIHGRTGRIRERDSYNSDPLPPREPRKVLHPSAPPRTTKRKNIGRAITEADLASRS